MLEPMPTVRVYENVKAYITLRYNMQRRRSTLKEKLDFFLQLDTDLRSHPTHRPLPAHLPANEYLPWTQEAIFTILLHDSERKRTFVRYTRQKGKCGVLGPRLWRMFRMLEAKRDLPTLQ